MATYHTNVVYLTLPEGWTLSYPPGGAVVITPGQIPTPAPTPDVTQPTGDVYLWTASLYCGRKADYNVANGNGSPENQNITGFNIVAPSSFASVLEDPALFPNELNFYFQLELTALVAGAPQPCTIYLAQGNAKHLTNNWWLGGPNIDPPQTDQPALFILDDGATYIAYPISSDVMSFDISSKPWSPST